MNTIMGAARPLVNEITHYLSQLNVQQQKAVLSIVKTFAREQKDWWDELGEEQRQAIKEAEAELDAGKGIAHEQVMKKYKKWL